MENQSIEKTLVESLLAEHRSTRRWKNARFIVWSVLFLAFLFLMIGPNLFSSADDVDGHSYVSLIRLDGVIAAGNPFSAEKVIPELNRAFRNKNAKGVVLLINSPGGSPVQASLIHDKIMQLKEKYHKEVIVVGGDTLASGAYLVSTAADKIFVNPDTVTGSIGVIMEGFGFDGIMQKIGVSRRVFTAGDNKDRLDPFEPIRPQDKIKVQHVLDAVHQSFIADVEQGRKGKLNGDPKELFSGDFWTGSQAVKLGIADATATPWVAMQETFGTTYYHDYSPRPGFFESVVRDVSTQLHIHLMNNNAKLEEVM